MNPRRLLPLLLCTPMPLWANLTEIETERHGTWILEEHAGARAVVLETDRGLRLSVRRPGTADWHVQLYRRDVGLEAGDCYLLRYRIRSGPGRFYSVGATADGEDHRGVGLWHDGEARRGWREVEIPFRAVDPIPGRTRLPNFQFGRARGSFWIDGVELEALEADPCDGTALERPTAFYPYVTPADQALEGSAWSAAHLNAAPAGADGRIVAQDGRFLASGTGERIRFFGTNVGGRAAFLSPEEADRAAGILASYGINLVRFHHLQNMWEPPGGFIWKPDAIDREIDPDQLDKLDYFIAALKARGIYSNLNLTTARRYHPDMGFPESVYAIEDLGMTFAFMKKVDKFDQRMIELQRDYARELLDRVNPYTGNHYRDEPALVKIEINNENSLVGWPGEPAGHRLHELPEPWRGELRERWNDWLAERHASHEDLVAAWFGAEAGLGASLLPGGHPWSNANIGEGNVHFAPSLGQPEPAIVVSIESNPGPDWFVQAHLPGLTLREGGLYTLSFCIRGEEPGLARVTVNRDIPDWRNHGVDAVVPVETGWGSHSFVFTASDVLAGHVRVAFVLGGLRGRVEIDDVRLRPGANPEAVLGGTLDGRSIGLLSSGPAAAFRDYARFLADVETAYAQGMRAFLREDLGFADTMIIDTQFAYGGVTAFTREAGMEFADNHGYWQHPAFEAGVDWDPERWSIQNSPMSPLSGGGALLGSLARGRPEGLPYSISEYDHPAPSDYQAEMLPLLAWVASLQDWDALYLFSWNAHATGPEARRISGWFDVSSNPAKLTFLPQAATLFREARVAALPATTVLDLPADPLRAGLSFEGAWRQVGSPPDPLRHRLAVRIGDGEAARKIVAGAVDSPARREEGLRGDWVHFESGEAVAVAGRVGGERIETAYGSFTFGRFGRDFAALMLGPVGDRLHLAVVAGVENTGQEWNADRTSVGTQWGESPTLLERVPVRFRPAEPLLVRPIDDELQPGEPLEADAEGWIDLGSVDTPRFLLERL